MQNERCNMVNEGKPARRRLAAVHLSFFIFHFAFCTSLSLGGSIPEEFRIKRQEVFQFAEKPTVTRDGDTVTIRFASKGFCDVTVAIEEGPGFDEATRSGRFSDPGTQPRIIRHLASGVLGPNAPAPFAKNSLAQTLLWDGKDDQGRYVDDLAALGVRISLGLNPRFERSLYWGPHKRTSPWASSLAAAPEGVYVCDGWVLDTVRLFDHKGNYIRTVYPFPADRLDTFTETDLHWKVFPQDGVRLPLRQGEHQATLLTSGDNIGFGTFGKGPKHQTGSAASAIAVHGGRIALAKFMLNRISTEGGNCGLALNGPKISLTDVSKALPWRGGGEPIEAVPRSLAFSPDGQWLYSAGHHWFEHHGTGGVVWRFLHCVLRTEFAADKPAELFLGSIREDDSGRTDAKFNVPTSVACDPAGRVYVSDYMNDRVQVYQPDGQFVRSIPVAKPAHVAVHRRTGEIFVFSWTIRNQESWKDRTFAVKPTLTRLGPLDGPDGPKLLATLPLPLPQVGRLGQEEGGGTEVRVELDSWAEEPTVWIMPGTPGESTAWERAGIRVAVVRDNRLEMVRDFGAETRDAVFRGKPPANLRQRLYVNPVTGTLYLAEPDAGVNKSTGQLLQIDPQTGRVSPVELPFDAEDFAFDPNGLVLLRGLHEIGRFDPRTWREVPWDYGEERAAAGFASSRAEGPGKRNSPLISGLAIPVNRYNHHGGMMVSARGRVVVAIHGGQEVGADRRETPAALTEGKAYTFRMYPGRSTDGLVLIFDQHGRLVGDDVVPGIAFTHGVGIDRDDNVYLMAMAARVLNGQRYFNEATDTVMKFASSGARVLSTGARAVPLPASGRPNRSPDLSAPGGGRLHNAWAEGAQWFYGGVGFHARHSESQGYGCDCFNSRFDLDYFARSFAPEVERGSVAVLDASGNLILRVGRYGNPDDGVPLTPDGGPAKPRAIGGDEVSLFYAPYVATHTDRRLFIADPGNARIVSVKLGYHTTETVPLK